MGRPCQKVLMECEICHKKFLVQPYRLKRGQVKHCSKACRKAANQQVHKSIRRDGYVRLTGNKLDIAEHRYIMEQIIGRPLYPWEEVHHKDGNKTNNDPANLQLMSNRDEHRKEHPHHKNPAKQAILTCAFCNRRFTRLKTDIKPNVVNFFCRRECYDAFRTRSLKAQEKARQERNKTKRPYNRVKETGIDGN